MKLFEYIPIKKTLPIVKVIGLFIFGVKLITWDMTAELLKRLRDEVR